ncbi:MAG: hypothetical protein METHP_01978 [Methanoregula sp. SKADARSKE-2]|nr:MAG: hypothetical protein METHP_01978 [Methanoregula sp. SKADARSKE-2]
MERADNTIMSGPYHSLFVKGFVIIAVLLALAVPAAAMKITPNTAVCSTSIVSHSAGYPTLFSEISDCQHDCYHLCAIVCSDGWCMISCMRNCDRYCEEESS